MDGQIGTPSRYFLGITSENKIAQFNVSATKELGFIDEGVYAVFLNCDQSTNGDKQLINVRDHTQYKRTSLLYSGQPHEVHHSEQHLEAF